jgi:hypothetical protein
MTRGGISVTLSILYAVKRTGAASQRRDDASALPSPQGGHATHTTSRHVDVGPLTVVSPKVIV